MQEHIREAVIVCLLSMFLAGCKGVTRISATGDAVAPTFILGDDGVPVSSLEVVRYCIENGRLGSIQMWMLDRMEKPVTLDRVVYGKVPPGFSQTIQPGSLGVRDFYSVEVAGLRNDASGFFALNRNNGRVMVVNIENLNDMSLIDWLESKRSVYNVSCRRQR